MLECDIAHGWKSLQGTNTLAYLTLMTKKKYNIATWGQCYKTFLSTIYEFLYQARVFIRLGWKSLQGTNTLAYLTLVTKKKFFATLPPGANVLKLFSSLLTMKPNKLDCLHLAKAFMSSLKFAGNTQGLTQEGSI